jgi:hypothetical protein
MSPGVRQSMSTLGQAVHTNSGGSGHSIILQVKIFSSFILRKLCPVIKRAWTVHRVWSPVSFPILNQSVLYRKVRKVSFSPCNSYDDQRVGTLIKKKR